MAVRFDASGDQLTRTNLSGAQTVMGWFYISTDRNAYSALISVNANNTVALGSDGTTLIHWDGSDEPTGTNLSTATWYHITLALSNTDLGATATVYLNGVSDITNVLSAAASGSTLYIGNDPVTEWLNGRAAHIKMWNAQLTAAEIIQEMRVARPVRLTNLYLWTPLYGSGDVNDYSGNGRNWTAGGTLTTEDGPPVGYGAPILYAPFVASGGTANGTPDPAAGSATVSVVGRSTARSAADAAAGSATVSVAGRSTAESAADAAAGVATVSVAGRATTNAAPDAAAGSATVSVAGRSTARSAADAAAGTATVSVAGRSTAASAVDAAPGAATVAVVGRSTARTTPDPAAGVATVSVTSGGAASGAPDPAAGVATVSAVGRSTARSAADSATGAATVSVVGRAIVAATATAAAGAATVSAAARSTAAAIADVAAGIASVTVAAVSTARAAFVPAAGLATVSVAAGGMPTRFVAVTLPARPFLTIEARSALRVTKRPPLEID